MHPGPGRRSARVLPWHPPARAGGDDGPQHGYIPGVNVYNHNFCCTEQGRRLALHCNGGNFPRANLRDLEKPPQGTCGSFALLSFSEQSQTSLQLESPVAVLQTLTKPALLGSKATTNFLPNGSCQAAKMPAVGLDTASIKDYRQSLHARCAKPHRKMVAIVRAILQRPQETCRALEAKGAPDKPPHCAAPASPIEHGRGPRTPQASWEHSSGSASLKVSA